MAVAEGFAALKSLKSIYDIAKEARDSNDPEKLRVAAGQMLDLLMAAREQAVEFQDRYFAVKEDLAALQSEIKKTAEFDAQAQGYKRVRLGGGGFAYVEFTETQSTEGDAPYFCPTCFGDKAITILQPTRDGGRGEYTCPKCETMVD